MEPLLQKIQFENDQQAFRQLYESLFFRLYQFAFAYVHVKESAEEIVNDVFLGLWQKRCTMDTIGNINVYLYVSVKNASLNYLRKNKKTTPISLDDLTVYHLKITSNPETLLVTHELQICVQAAIEQLPPRCRLIFKMIKEDGLSYKETASILDISVKTVDAQLCLALKKLAQTLLPAWTEYQSSAILQKRNG